MQTDTNQVYNTCDVNQVMTNIQAEQVVTISKMKHAKTIGMCIAHRKAPPRQRNFMQEEEAVEKSNCPVSESRGTANN